MSEASSAEAWAKTTGAPTLNLSDMENLAALYNERWAIYEEKKSVASEAYASFEEVESKIIKALIDAQKSSYKSELGTMTLKHAVSVLTPKSLTDKKAFFKWVEELGPEVYYSKLGIDSKTLNSWYKQLKEDAAPGFQIPGVVEGSERVTLSFISSKKGK